MSRSGHTFKKPGLTPVEINLREAKIKKKLTSELSAAIKTLQQEHCNTGEAILSTDAANQVCNVIEAVFLHGIKHSVAQKIGKYVGLQNGETAYQNVNFWSFVTKFTHKDTTSQLTRLGQITSDIGLCRAWIRVALNDGLITSYVDAMLSDKKALQHYYHRIAYLNDFDQQEIFKSFLKGLMILEFKLSYNSRVLNSWTNTPLELTGIIECDNTPLPVIQSSVKQESGHNTEQHSSFCGNNTEQTGSDAVKVVRKQKKSRSIDESKTPPNTPYDVDNFAKGFTRQDVENLKNYPSGSSPHDTECSSSSQISCPDPVKYNKNPAVFLENKEDAMFTLNEEEDQNMDMYVADDIESVIKRAAADKRGVTLPDIYVEDDMETVIKLNNVQDERGITPPDMYIADDIESVIKIPSVQEERGATHHENDKDCNGAENCMNKQYDSLSQGYDSPVNFYVETNDRNDQTTEDVTDGNLIQAGEQTELKHHHDRILADILNDGRNSYHDPSPEPSDSVIVNTSGSPFKPNSPVSTAIKIRGTKDSLKPDFDARKHESEPEISPAVANSIETSKMKYSRHRYSLPNIRSYHYSPQNSHHLFGTISESPATRPRSESDKADETNTPSSIGNSLGAISGWSSSFNLEAEDKVEPLPESRQNDIPYDRRPKAESFGTLLQNYTPSSSVTSPTIEAVINDLPGSADISYLQQQHKIYEVEDDMVLIEGYEVPPSLSDAMNQAKLAILGQIANEKGLDAQNYQCKGCTRPVGLIYGKPRVCTFDGWYYCFECHENDEYYIPALVVHNWDFRKHPVAKCNYKFLQEIEDQAKLDISKINPKLYEHVKEMADLKFHRTQLYYLKTYLFTCNQSIADEFRQTLWPREYFYENIHMYSLSDFLQVPSGTLLLSLKKVIKFATKHVYDCRLCSQKGYICELCNQVKVIYPFEVDSTVRCKQCKSVFHKTCKVEGKPCPKCLRKQQRRSQMGYEPETPDIQDYAFVPQ